MNPQQQPAPTPAPADPRQQVLEQIKKGTNVLITVSENPNVDQLAAVIGTTLLLNKLGKHATAVFSGKIPSTIQFLQPEKTLEKNTDSLRDFIIALDKAKADKLRYKIEDKFVKIFITPYHTSLNEKDLQFGQGEFNVDVVLALGVMKREELDKAIFEHGRIFHDATVISVNNVKGADLGSINWVQESASGLSEMMVGLVEDLKTEKQPKLVDEQIATCFLTGIVAQTDRFSNTKTTPVTMNLAARLMNAGANQQLIATKLQPPAPPPPPPPAPKPPAPAPKPPTPTTRPEPPKPPAPPPASPVSHKVIQPPIHPPKPEPKLEPEPEKPKETEDGALLVPHDGITGENVAYSMEPDENIAKIHIDNEGVLKRVAEEEAKPAAQKKRFRPAPPSVPPQDDPDNRKIVSQPPSMGGELSASTQPPAPGQTNANAGSDPLSLPDVTGPTLNHGQPGEQADQATEAASTDENKVETLSDIEQAVNSPHLREVDDNKSTDANGLPTSIVGSDNGLPPDDTAGNNDPAPPPPVPPPLTIAPPGNGPPKNMTGGNTGMAL